jgi:hypothetical protein
MRQDLPPAKTKEAISASPQANNQRPSLHCSCSRRHRRECVHLPLQCPRPPELLQAQSPGQDHPCQLEPVSLSSGEFMQSARIHKRRRMLVGPRKGFIFECRDESPDHSTGRISVRSFWLPKIRCLATVIPDSFRPSLRNLLSISNNSRKRL